MIIILLTLALFIIPILIGIILERIDAYTHSQHDMSRKCCAILSYTGFFALLIFVTICIISNVSSTIEKTRIKYQENVISLNATYNCIINSSLDDHSKNVAIQSYNEDVKKFKKEIEDAQSALNNNWTSWFIPPVYNEFDVNAVSYIDYVGVQL